MNGYSKEVRHALGEIHRHRHLLTAHQYRTLMGQAKANQPAAALKGLRTALRSNKHTKRAKEAHL